MGFENGNACNNEEGEMISSPALQTPVVPSERPVDYSQILQATTSAYSLFFFPGIGIFDWILEKTFFQNCNILNMQTSHQGHQFGTLLDDP